MASFKCPFAAPSRQSSGRLHRSTLFENGSLNSYGLLRLPFCRSILFELLPGLTFISSQISGEHRHRRAFVADRKCMSLRRRAVFFSVPDHTSTLGSRQKNAVKIQLPAVHSFGVMYSPIFVS